MAGRHDNFRARLLVEVVENAADTVSTCLFVAGRTGLLGETGMAARRAHPHRLADRRCDAHRNDTELARRGYVEGRNAAAMQAPSSCVSCDPLHSVHWAPWL